MTLPVLHHTCSHPVCGHYKNTARQREFSVTLSFRRLNFVSTLQMPWRSFFYLTGVSCAGFRDVAVIDSITTRHSSQLVLSETQPQKKIKKREGQIKKWEKEWVIRVRVLGLNKQWKSMQLTMTWWLKAAHLAVSAAEPVAAHGIVGKSALLTAVGSTPCTLLHIRESLFNT